MTPYQTAETEYGIAWKKLRESETNKAKPIRKKRQYKPAIDGMCYLACEYLEQFGPAVSGNDMITAIGYSYERIGSLRYRMQTMLNIGALSCANRNEMSRIIKVWDVVPGWREILEDHK